MSADISVKREESSNEDRGGSIYKLSSTKDECESLIMTASIMPLYYFTIIIFLKGGRGNSEVPPLYLFVIAHTKS